MDTNIQVGIRVRPVIMRELQNGQKVIWDTESNCIFSNDRSTSYEFDRVFNQQTSTQHIYDVLGKPIVANVMEGFNGTMFAYGQTASGKTHTIMGERKSPGIIPLAIMDVFDHIEKSPDREFLMRASYLEIYNEEITDLLNNKKANVKVRNNVDNEVIIENITEESIISFDLAMDLVNTGKRNRMIGKTGMNEHSSRSHVIFRLIVESRLLPDGLNMSECDGAVIVSELNLVDLAGSERVAQTGAQGVRLKESNFINTSLLTLGLVIRKLSEKDGHIPYRDSKLTRILQNSLGGNARTSIICTVSPVVLDETNQTLKFAGRAKNVTNKPIINEVVDGDTQMRRQINEIRNLKKKIQELEEGPAHSEMLQEKDMMLAEKQMFSNKIVEQQSKISKLLKEIVCSGRRKPEEAKTRYQRRQTWCGGGGLKGLRAREIDEDEDGDSAGFSMPRMDAKSRLSGSLMVEKPQNISDLKENAEDSFEKHEYELMKEEFEEYKLTMQEVKKSTLELLREKEMETEQLKNQLRDKKMECERLKDNTEMDEWQTALNQTIEEKIQENNELKAQIAELKIQHDDFVDHVESQTQEKEDDMKIIKQLEFALDELKSEQENMVPKEFLDGLRKQMLVDSQRLEEESNICSKENEELKKTIIELEKGIKEQADIGKHQIEELTNEKENLLLLCEDLQKKADKLNSSEQTIEELQQERNNLIAAQIEQGISIEGKTLSESIVNEVQTTELEIKIEQLQVENTKLISVFEIAKVNAESELNEHQRISVERLSDTNKEVNTLKKELEDHNHLQVEYNDLKTTFENLVVDHEAISIKLEEAHKELRQASLQMDVVEVTSIQKNEETLWVVEKEALTLQLEEVSDLCNNLQVQMDTLKSENVNELQEKEQLKRKLETLQRNYHNLQSDVGTFKDVIESQEEEGKLLQEEFEKKCKEVNTLQGQLNIIGNNKGGSSSDTTTSQEQLESLEVVIKSLKDEKKEMISINSTMKQQLILQEFEWNSNIENMTEEMKKIEVLLQEKEQELSIVHDYQRENEDEFKNSTETIHELELQSKEFQDQLENTTKEKDDLKAHVQKLNDKIEQLKTTIVQDESTTKEKDDLEAHVQKLNDEIEQLKTTIVQDESTTKEKDDLEAHVQKLNDEIEQLKMTIVQDESTTKEKDDLKTHVQQLNDEIEQFKTTIVQNESATKEKEDLEAHIQTLNNEIEQLKTTIVQNESTIKEKGDLIQTLNNEIKQIKSTIAVNDEDESQELEEKYFHLQAEKKVFELKVQEHLETIENLSIDVEGMKELDTLSQNEISLKTEEIHLLQTQLNTVQVNNEDLQSALELLKEELKQMNESPVNSESTICIDEDTITQLQLDFERKTAEVAEKEKQISLLENEHEEFQNVYNNEKEKLTRAEEKCFHLQNDKEEAEEDKVKLGEEKEELACTIQQLKESLSEMQLALETREIELEDAGVLQSDEVKLREEFKNLEEELHKKNAEYSSLNVEYKKMEYSNGMLREVEETLQREKEEHTKLKEMLLIETEELTILKKSLETKTLQFVELNVELEEEKTSVMKWQEIMQIQEEAKDTLESDLEEKTKEIYDMKTQVETLQASMSGELQQTVDENIQHMKIIQDELNMKNEQVEMLNQQILHFIEKETEFQALQGIMESRNEELELKEAKIVELVKVNEEIEESFIHAKEQKDGLMGDLNELQINLVDMETELKDYKDSKAEMNEMISLGKEKLETLYNERLEFREVLQSVEQDNEALKSDIRLKNDEIDAITAQRDESNESQMEFKGKYDDVVKLNEQLNLDVSCVEAKIKTLQENIENLTALMNSEKNNCEEEKTLCKAAYERECKQKEAQANDLILCVKKLQAENIQFTHQNDILQNGILELKTRLEQNSDEIEEDSAKKEELIKTLKSELDTKSQELDDLNNKMSKYVERLQLIEVKVNETEKQRDKIEEMLLQTKEELTRTTKRYDELAHVDMQENGKMSMKEDEEKKVSSDVVTDDPQVNDFEEKRKRLEYRLNLRQEDIVVYKTRIDEQDQEIQSLNKKKNELKEQLKKVITRVEKMRRPSGNAGTAEWEETITRLENKSLKLENENEELFQKNDKNTRSVKHAMVRIKNYETKSNEDEKENGKLKEEAQRKSAELNKLSDGLKKAYSRMTAAETKLKECRTEFEYKLDLKKAEITKISGGLHTAFERYKHYKGMHQEKEKEINSLNVKLSEGNKHQTFLSNKLSQLETKIRSSLRVPGIDQNILQDISQNQDRFMTSTSVYNQNPVNSEITHNQSLSSSSENALLTNVEKDKELTLSSLESDLLLTLGVNNRQPNSLDVTKENEKNSSFVAEKSIPSTISSNTEVKKRKSDEPLEGISRRRKMLQPSPKKEGGETECSQQ